MGGCVGYVKESVRGTEWLGVCMGYVKGRETGTKCVCV